MNLRLLRLSLVALVCAAASVTLAYEPPSEGDLDALMANPALVNKLLGDANGEQAAELMVRILDRIQKADVVQKQREYLAAYYAARFAFILGDEAKAFAEALLPNTPRDLLPAVLAGLATGGRGSAAFIDHLTKLVGEDELLLQAIKAPVIPLTPPVYSHLLGNLGSAQSLPPVVTDSLPPPIPVGEPPPGTRPPGPRPTPPIPEPYAGQR